MAAGALAALLPSCLESRERPEPAREERCTGCHGDPARPGDFLARSAPPADLSGATDPSYPGVGAHSIHLEGSATHPAFACTECHVVPERVDSPGHADSARPAELVFGPLARTDHHHPSYDAAGQTCRDSYCHRGARAVWSLPRSSGEACGTCHALPPPAPHPASTRCSVCHADVVDENQRIIAPELHVNGTVEYRAGADTCTLCHGEGENPAPPLDTLGHMEVSSLGVGAHAAHLGGGRAGRPLECTECHRVPERVEDETHIDEPPAEVTLTGVAATRDHAPRWDHELATCSDTYCHGPGERHGTSPLWTEATELSCTSCHGAPPPPPHPRSARCENCHANVVNDSMHIVDRARHVNGIVDVVVTDDCSACHGGKKNAAPPLGVLGETLTSQAAVGAHQAHLVENGRARPVPCAECHEVPADVLAKGHLDSDLPAEVVFSGAALSFGATPRYENGRCVESACHGAVFPSAYGSGGSHTTPSWTRVNGSEAKCGTCHGLPPPRPHPYVNQSPDCSACHKDLDKDNVTFVRPDLHVNGQVTFELPN